MYYIFTKHIRCALTKLFVLQIDYPSFEKNFYIEHEEIAKLPNQDVNELKKKLGIKVGKILNSAVCSLFIL